MLKIIICIFCVISLISCNIIVDYIDFETVEADPAIKSVNISLELENVEVQTKTVDLSCTYKFFTDWWAIDYAYFCEQNQAVKIVDPDTRVAKVKGTHKELKDNSDVRGFRVNGQSMAYLPKGLNKFFDNLEFLAIWTTDLMEIHSEDLAQFTKLRILSIWENKIEYLEKDLMKFNPNIEYIGFGKNRIQYVDSNVFDPLTRLHTLHFDGNDCYSKQVAGDRIGVLKMIDEMNEHCNSNEV
ncbi:hypothetical protein ACKWTF_015863 [Chironomus riparius]